MNLGWMAYRTIAPALGSLAPMARWFTSPHERDLWNERLGFVAGPRACDAWVHASSLGEAMAVPPLVEALVALMPAACVRLTATTRHGRGRLSGLGLPLSLAPFDVPQAVGRFFERTHPGRLILVETELWPHWLLGARAARVPVLVVSGRLSSASVRRYRQLGPEFRALITSMAGVVAQTDTDAERWLAIGVRPERLAVGGNLKHDALPAQTLSHAEARTAVGLERDRPLLVLGCLRPGEARILARAWLALPSDLRAAWQVVAVPRHSRATRELIEEATAAGIRSATEASEKPEWRWDDRPGVLLGYYAGADVAFVGGSLVPRGGHNPLEPAAFGAAVVMGAHHASQAGGVSALAAKEGITVVRTAEELRAALARHLENEVVRTRAGSAARDVAAGLRGAARRTAARLAAWDVWPPR